jgi:hypothetical protein
MFNEKGALAAQQAELGGVVPGRFARGQTIYNLPFILDLGAEVNEQSLLWRYLPGRATQDWFVSNPNLKLMLANGSGAWTFGASHNHEGLLVRPGVYTWRTYQGQGLPVLPTGVTVGVLGAWVTGDSTVLNISHDNALSSTTLTDYRGVRNPFEYNGHLFFSGFTRNQVTNEAIIPVIGYVENHPFVEDVLFLPGEGDRWTVEHFSIEHLGYGAQVGLYQGNLVVATSKGVWGIEGISDGGYKLGGQVLSWSLSDAPTFAICLDAIAALDGGDLLVVTPASRTLYPQTRFTSVASDGHSIVLGGAEEVALINGDGWSSYRGYTAVGALVRGISTLLPFYFPEPAPITYSSQTTTIQTMTMEFDAPMNFTQLLIDDKVVSAKVTWDRGVRVLRQSVWNGMVWKGGFTTRTFKLELEVPLGQRIQMPVLYMTPRRRV